MREKKYKMQAGGVLLTKSPPAELTRREYQQLAVLDVRL